MAKTGRPRKDPAERITQFGMTAKELEALAAYAESKDRSLSFVVRAIGTAALDQPEFLDQAVSRLDAAGNAAGVAIPPAHKDT